MNADLSLVESVLHTPLPAGAAEGLQLLLHDHQPLLHVQLVLMEVLVFLNAPLALANLRLKRTQEPIPPMTRV